MSPTQSRKGASPSSRGARSSGDPQLALGRPFAGAFSFGSRTRAATVEAGAPPPMDTYRPMSATAAPRFGQFGASDHNSGRQMPRCMNGWSLGS